MGRIGKIEKITDVQRHGAESTDLTLDPGAGADITAELLASPGEDSKPLPGDYAIIEDVTGSGRGVVVGTADPNLERKAGKGEKRIYSRDPSGSVVAESHLKSDGSIISKNSNISIKANADGSGSIENSAGSFALLSSGDIVINGVTFKPNGVVEGLTSLKDSTAREYVGHKHTSTAPGTPTSENI